MPTSNDEYQDAALRHQIGVRRYTAGEIKKILKLLEKADAELAKILRKHLAKLAGKPLDLSSDRFRALAKDIKAARDGMIKELRATVRKELKEFSKVEADFEDRLLKAAVPVEITFATVAVDTLYALVTTQPFAGGANAARTLEQWFDSLRQVDQRRIIDAVQLGLSQGETVDQLARRVVGTKKLGYKDGILAMTRRDAEAVVRTAANHVSNAAREQVWLANADIVAALKWTSVLDGRTSAVCRGRDGALTPIGDNPLPRGAKKLDPPGARPPAHPNCRSIMVAVLDGEGLANTMSDRPYVTDTRTGRQRQIDFRAETKAQYGSMWKDMSALQRNKAIADAKRAWAEANVGRLPAETTYDQFLKRQSTAFQDEVLGKTKGRLFRTGKLTLDQFVDRAGNELTLAQLADQHPGVFRAAKLDPETFD